MWVSKKDYRTVGAILAGVREEANVSQKELAAQLSKPQSFVSHYESGQRRIDLLEFLRIMDALGADGSEVFQVISRKFSGAKPRAAKR